MLLRVQGASHQWHASRWATLDAPFWISWLLTVASGQRTQGVILGLPCLVDSVAASLIQLVWPEWSSRGQGTLVWSSVWFCSCDLLNQRILSIRGGTARGTLLSWSYHLAMREASSWNLWRPRGSLGSTFAPLLARFPLTYQTWSATLAID